MGEFDFLENMKDEEELLFKRCIRKLLDARKILPHHLLQLGDIHAELQGGIELHLAVLLCVVLIPGQKAEPLEQLERRPELRGRGIKRSNLVVFDGKQVQMLLALWLLYLEKVGFSEEIYVTVGDVIDKCKVYGIPYFPSWYPLGLSRPPIPLFSGTLLERFHAPPPNPFQSKAS